MKKIEHVLVLGGTSYLGQALVHVLASKGYQVKVLSRRPERARALKVHINVCVQYCNAEETKGLKDQLIGMDVVINLMDNHAGRYEEINRNLARKVGKLCEENKVPRLIHLSAVGASSSSFHSKYLHAHAMAEKNLMALFFTKITILRPSWIIGRSAFGAPTGQLERLVAGMLKHKKINVFGADTEIAPIHIRDVVDSILSHLRDINSSERLVLVGPESMKIMDLVKKIKSDAFLKIAIHKVQNRFTDACAPFSFNNRFMFPKNISDFSAPLDDSEKVGCQRIQGKRSLGDALQELLQESNSEQYCRLRQ